jgi:hypothetical protein
MTMLEPEFWGPLSPLYVAAVTWLVSIGVL